MRGMLAVEEIRKTHHLFLMSPYDLHSFEHYSKKV